MTYLDRAIKDGYAIITGPENKQKIIYVTSDNHTENYNDPEEKVRAEFWAELIYEYDYPAHRIKVEVTIPDRVPTDRADIVIFSDDECKKPYAVVECKRDGVTDAEFLQAIEQGVGNATWVKLRASYVVIIAGATRRVLDFSDDSTGILERENNIIADLPKAYSNQQKRFFTKEKFDEKFQKRIDYFSKVAMSFFANHGYDTEGFTINPYMVVNKVFSSYYKHVQFPIVTFDELKREIQL